MKNTRDAAKKHSNAVVGDNAPPQRESIVKLELSPMLRNSACAEGHATMTFAQGVPSLETASEVTGLCQAVQKGDLSRLVAMLAAQAVTLDAIFTDYSRRAFINSGEFLPAAETYSNLALKAQAQCRTTVETLARIKRGGRQTVKVIHVHEGAQAVVADTFNQGGRGGTKRKQPHAKSNACVAALRSPDEAGHRLFGPGRQGKATLPDARREKSGGTDW